MKRQISSAFLLLTVACFSYSCKKSTPFQYSDAPPTNVPACLLSVEQNDGMTVDGDVFTLTYDAGGLLTNVSAAAAGSSTPLASISVSGQQIVRTESDYTDSFSFDKNIFTDQPTAYTYGNSKYTKTFRTAKITFNGSRQLTRAQAFDAGNGLLQTMDFTYDGNQDVTAITITQASAGSVPLVYAATGYDQMNSPYYGQKGTQLLTYNWDFFTITNYPRIFEHLSRHNIKGWGLTSGTTSEAIRYDYTYNNQGYPITSIETTANTFNGSTLVTTVNTAYTYNCP